MPTVTLAAKPPKAITALDVPVASDEIDQLPQRLADAATQAGFKGKVGETVAIYNKKANPVEILLGIGLRSELSADSLRKAAASLVRSASSYEAIATTLIEAAPEVDRAEAIGAVVEGLQMSTYKFTDFKSDKDNSDKDSPEQLKRVSIIASGKGAKAELVRAKAVVDAVNFSRDLVNTPGGVLTPAEFAKRTNVVAKASGLTVSVWDEKRIKREKLGGLIAVNLGSTKPARFVRLSYKPQKKASATVALVGKGITFDSGGLSIKSSAGMMNMKVDMAGAATVVAAMSALRAVDCPVAVEGFIPLTDNMTGGNAQRPGDVFTARNGKTVEVLNTDAEGRLVLADALSLAAETEPDAIIDVATLTGAASAALGLSIAALMGTDDHLCDRLLEASQRSGDQLWRLPLPSEYRSELDSSVADLRNIGSGRNGGALVAGLFLKEFTADLPWAHIDLGMSALTEKNSGLLVKGATGMGVRLLVDALANWSAAPKVATKN